MTDLLDIESILDAATLPETIVSVCVAGELAGEYRRVLAKARTVGAPTSLGDDTAATLARQLEDIREQMLAKSYDLVFRALPPTAFDGHLDEDPRRAERPKDETPAQLRELILVWQLDLVSMCSKNPKMTVEQARRLHDAVGQGQWVTICNGVFGVNADAVAVPFSLTGSAASRDSGETSQSLDLSGLAGASFLAGLLEGELSEPSTDTTTPAG